MQKTSPTLLFCIAMDAIGSLSYIVPAATEFTDIIWAPLSAYIFLKSFGGRIGKFGAAINFVEEALPFTDIVPTFTIAYFVKSFFVQKNEIQNI